MKDNEVVGNRGLADITLGSVGQTSGVLDTFNRIRVSSPMTLFDAQLQYDGQPLLWETKITGTATEVHDPNNSAVNLNVFNDGDILERQQREYNRYQPGKSALVMMTYTPDENVTDGSIEFVLRSSSGAFPTSTPGVPFDFVVPQADWNVDKLDGSGPSGITLDLTASQIFITDFEWLSVGIVRYGLVLDGVIRYCHFVQNANSLRGAYMTTANLPLKYLISRVGTDIAKEIGYNDYNNGMFVRYKGKGTTAALKEICTTVLSEGGQEEFGIPFSPSSGLTPVTITAGSSIVLAARHSLTFKGIENHVKFIPKSYFIGSSDEKVFARVVYNPTVIGGAWVPFVDGGAESGMEVNLTATSITGGLTVDPEFIYASTTNQSINSQGATKRFTSKLPYGIGIDSDTPIPLALEISNMGAGPTDVDFGLNWIEVR